MPPGPPSYRIEPLGPRHDRAAFFCGVEPLDRYFRTQAGQDVRKLIASCFVAVAADSPNIAGYYTLSATGIALTDLPSELAKRLPRYPLLPAILMGRIAGRFARVEPRRHARDLLLGLMSDLPGKNCWTIAEHAGERCPRGMQRLLSAAVWDEAGVRDDLRGYVLEHFADPGAVLVVDETGDLKKGT